VKKLAKTLSLVPLLMTSNVWAAEPQWEVKGFPISPVQAMILQPKKMQETTPTFAPQDPVNAIMVTAGNGKVHTIKFYVATQPERTALIAALRSYPELQARVRNSKNILFVDGYEPLSVSLGQ
jgi:hypothetical protein